MDERQLWSLPTSASTSARQSQKGNDGAACVGGHGRMGARRRGRRSPFRVAAADRRRDGSRAMSPRRHAFIDIGTNAILCLIVELRDTGRFRVLEDLAEIPRLGEGVDQTKRIGAAGGRRGTQGLGGHLSPFPKLGAQKNNPVGS